MAKQTPKRRSPQDATLRNTQAANKKIAALTTRLRSLERRVDRWTRYVYDLVRRFDA